MRNNCVCVRVWKWRGRGHPAHELYHLPTDEGYSIDKIIVMKRKRVRWWFNFMARWHMREYPLYMGMWRREIRSREPPFSIMDLDDTGTNQLI